MLPSENVTEEQLRRFEKRRNRRQGVYGGSARTAAFHETLINLSTARHDLIVDDEPCQSCNISAADLLNLEKELEAEGFPSLGIKERLGLPEDFDPLKMPPPVHPLPLDANGGYPLLENTGTVSIPWSVKNGQVVMGNWSRTLKPAHYSRTAPLIERIAKEKGLDPYAWLAKANIESGFNPSAANKHYAGLYQIPKGTKGAYDAETNMRFAISLYFQNKRVWERKFPGDPFDVGRAYLLHQQGMGGGPQLYSDRGTNILAANSLLKLGVWRDKERKNGAGYVQRSVINVNGGNSNTTACEFAYMWITRAQALREAYSGKTSGVLTAPCGTIDFNHSIRYGGSTGGSVSGDNGGISTDGGGTPVQTTARKPTFTGAPSVCKDLPVDAKVKEAFELAFKELYPEGKVDFGPVPTSQPPLGQVTPPPASPGSGGYTQSPAPGTTVGANGQISNASGKTISVGDSFAEGHQKANRATIQAGVRSRSPEMVLDAIKAIPKSDIAGSEVFLSTGTANRLGMTSKENIIRQQLEYLTSAGPCMILVSGIGESQQDKPVLAKKSNDMVAKLVNEFKAKFPNIRFLGAIPMSQIASDKVHPVGSWYTTTAKFTGCSKK